MKDSNEDDLSALLAGLSAPTRPPPDPKSQTYRDSTDVYLWFLRSAIREDVRLKKSRAAADEELLRLVTDGYRLVAEIERNFREAVAAGTFDVAAAGEQAVPRAKAWMLSVAEALAGIFPTDREAYVFTRPERPPGLVMADQIDHYKFKTFLHGVREHIRELDDIRRTALTEYTDLPVTTRLFVECIDSFAKVRDVNRAEVADVLRDGRVELPEDYVQVGLEEILGVPFHRKDWGGENNDLYTANVVVNGARTPTAFLLKGNGCRSRELTIADCGKNGDQILRLFDSPAALLVVQYIGNVSDAVVKDVDGKVEQRRGSGKPSWYCVMDGQDTARLLHAYGKLKRG